MPLPLGVPAPWFMAASLNNPRFAFSSVGGRFVLLAFLPSAEADRQAAVQLLSAFAGFYHPERLVCFALAREPVDRARVCGAANLTWLFDEPGEVFRAYRALDPGGEAQPHWLLLDPMLRVLAGGRFDEAERLEGHVRRLPAPDDHAGIELHAPVLIVPRIFEPAICQQLIDHYETTGGAPSGVMRDIGGRTVGVLDDFKRRRDAPIEDEGFRSELRARIRQRLVPEIEKAFQFKATRLERYIVACYDADEGGYFRPHRDNTTLATAHRQFACSINLNTEAFEGGGLRFPEYGARTYRPPTGGAVVFSCALLHEATPVTRGRRYAFLPFLYDDAAAQVRVENQKHLAAASPGQAGAPPAAEVAEGP